MHPILKQLKEQELILAFDRRYKLVGSHYGETPNGQSEIEKNEKRIKQLKNELDDRD